MKHFVLAWQFLTILPLTRKTFVSSEEDLARSMAFFPVVGVVLGLLLAGFEHALSGWVSRGLTAFFLIGLLALMTGGLHLDGFADTVDGLAGGRTKEDILRIMRDEQVGAFAVVGLIVLLGLRYQALTDLPQNLMAPGLVLMPVVGRWAMVVATAMSPYARNAEGLAKPFIEYCSPFVVTVATVITLVISLALFQVHGLLQLGVLGAAVAGMVAYCRFRCGGITGDILGALNELTEVLFLIALPVIVRKP